QRRQRGEDCQLRSGIPTPHVVEPVAITQMVADRNTRLLEDTPQSVVPLVVIVGQPHLARKVREVDGTGAKDGESFYLGHCVIDVDDRNLVGDYEPLRVVRREICEVVGECPADRSPVALYKPERSDRTDL